MEKASAHWIGPRPITLLGFCSKAKGDDWSSVIVSVSIGNNLNFPVKRWGLRRHQQRVTVRGRNRQGIPPTASSQWEGREEVGWPGASHLNWQGGGGVDEGAPGKTSSSTGVSQECDRGEVRGEHAGTDWREHSRRAPGDLFGLQLGQERGVHSTKQTTTKKKKQTLITLSEEVIFI